MTGREEVEALREVAYLGEVDALGWAARWEVCETPEGRAYAGLCLARALEELEVAPSSVALESAAWAGDLVRLREVAGEHLGRYGLGGNVYAVPSHTRVKLERRQAFTFSAAVALDLETETLSVQPWCTEAVLMTADTYRALVLALAEVFGEVVVRALRKGNLPYGAAARGQVLRLVELAVERGEAARERPEALRRQPRAWAEVDAGVRRALG